MPKQGPESARRREERETENNMRVWRAKSFESWTLKARAQFGDESPEAERVTRGEASGMVKNLS